MYSGEIHDVYTGFVYYHEDDKVTEDGMRGT
jgi:hypothetical protein